MDINTAPSDALADRLVAFYRKEKRLYDCLYNTRPKGRIKTKEAITNNALEAFVTEQSPLQALGNFAAGVNIFEILNVTDYEARHSNLIAWLLDPKETHGLGVKPLRAFYREVTGNDWSSLTENTVSVERERRGRIDLLAVDHHAKQGLIIENKVHSGEHTQQLRRYRERIQGDFPDYEFTYIFLTPGEGAPTDDKYRSVSYERIASWLSGLMSAQSTKEFSGKSKCSILWFHFLDYVTPTRLGWRAPNIFKALRLREIRHSAFWCWLLNPASNHNLGEAPMRVLLSLLKKNHDPAAIELLDKETINFSDLIVRQEENDSDIILISEHHNWVCLIELKTASTESKGQLLKYRTYLETWYPDCRRSLVFMTTQGITPSGQKFTSVGVVEWSAFFESLVSDAVRPDPSTELSFILAEYRDLILDRLDYFNKTVTVAAPRMRSAMADVWRSHHHVANRFLDEIKTWQKIVQRDLEEFIAATVCSSFNEGCFRPTRFPGSLACYMPFVPMEWRSFTTIWTGGGDKAFESQVANITIINLPFSNPFQNAENMGLTLVIGLTKPRPGYEKLREIIYEEARKEGDLFNTARNASGAGIKGQVRLAVHHLVSHEECRSLAESEIKRRFKYRWERFHRYSYPRLTALLSHQNIRDYVPV